MTSSYYMEAVPVSRRRETLLDAASILFGANAKTQIDNVPALDTIDNAIPVADIVSTRYGGFSPSQVN